MTHAVQQGSRRRPHQRPAAATVELAILVALFLSTFLYGMFELSRAMIVLEVITDASRAGCRASVEPGATTTSITNAVDAVMQANGLPTYEPVSIPTDPATANSGDQISVQVSIKARNFAWFPSFTYLTQQVNGRGTDAKIYSQKLVMRKQ